MIRCTLQNWPGSFRVAWIDMCLLIEGSASNFRVHVVLWNQHSQIKTLLKKPGLHLVSSYGIYAYFSLHLTNCLILQNYMERVCAHCLLAWDCIYGKSLKKRGTVPVSIPGCIRILPLHGHIIFFYWSSLPKLKSSWQKKWIKEKRKSKKEKR